MSSTLALDATSNRSIRLRPTVPTSDSRKQLFLPRPASSRWQGQNQVGRPSVPPYVQCHTNEDPFQQCHSGIEPACFPNQKFLRPRRDVVAWLTRCESLVSQPPGEIRRAGHSPRPHRNPQRCKTNSNSIGRIDRPLMELDISVHRPGYCGQPIENWVGFFKARCRPEKRHIQRTLLPDDPRQLAFP